MNPIIDSRVVVKLKGQNGEPVPGFNDLSFGEEYTIKSFRKLGDDYWIKVADPKGQIPRFEYRFDIFREAA